MNSNFQGPEEPVDETEGHRLRHGGYIEGTDDDVEGHRLPHGGQIEGTDDDVEGHRLTPGS